LGEVSHGYNAIIYVLETYGERTWEKKYSMVARELPGHRLMPNYFLSPSPEGGEKLNWVASCDGRSN
jgi:hypothetical protein